MNAFRARRNRTAPGITRAAVSVLAALLAAAAVALVPASAQAAPAASSCGTTDVALDRPATASSTESGQFPASAAVDGSTSTRWSSAWSDPQWIQVDLGSVQSICQVVLDWENPAYGTAYTIQVSSDGASWTTIYSTTAGAGGTETLNVTGSGRYIRMDGTARASGYGYSLWEFGVYAGAGSGSGTPPPGNWTPVWSDNFAGSAGSAPSAANWITDTGTTSATGAANWGTGEVETMSSSPSNVYLDGHGHLDLTAVNSGGAWTSGRVETQRDDFAAPAGGELMISASIEQPGPASGLGYWPKFFTLGAGYRGSPASWPAVGETDIMEDVNGRSESSETLHCGTAPGGNCNEYNGLTSGLSTCSGCQTGYHTYSEIIDRTTTNEQIRYYIDGNQVWAVRESQVGASTWQAAIDHGFSIVADLAIGGSYPNAVCGCTSPSAATSSGGTLSIGSLSVQQSTGTAPPPYTTPSAPSGPSVVKVTGNSLGSYGLSVNGAAYQMKGVTFGPANGSAAAYMPDLQSMGVNTIRTWGTDSTTETLLDAAAPYGIKVINGFWLSQTEDYVNDTSYKSSTLASIVALVNQYKNNPAVLMWDVGNEVLLNLPNVYSGSELTAEENAYVQYVDQIAQAIHQADPNHPVTSTDAWRPGIFQFYQANAPDLDLISVNDYGDVCNLKADWSSDGFTKPYIVTESGPAGEWEVPNDANGVPVQETDQQNAAGYASAWGCITGNPGISLGGTLFNYGTENDFGGVWYNLNTGGWDRLSYDEVTKLFTGTEPANTAPVISSMTVSQDSAVPAGGQFTVSAGVSDPDGDPLSYNLMLSSKYVDGSTGLQYAAFTQTGTGTFSVTAPTTIGVWKVYLYAYDGHGNVGIQTVSFRVVPPPVSGTDVALGKPTTASSYQSTGTGAPYPPSNATDGSDTTRWASDWSDPQWLEVDLGQVTTINHIQLVWEDAYATAYQIQVSTDGTNWTTIYSTTTGSGNVEDFNVTGSGRYVRLYGTTRGTSYGYSLWEFGVYQT
jgi:F5/8 type C domain/Glycosyl hydrolases family 2, TIM barrel domain